MAKTRFTITNDGSVQCLRNKVFDLRKLGKATHDRATDIKFDESDQLFAVYVFELGGYLSVHSMSLVDGYDTLTNHIEDELTAKFDTYEEAVAYEINFINSLDANSDEYRQIYKSKRSSQTEDNRRLTV